ncbi:MAG: glycosyltransferase family 9 protein [Planctomycetes bacterium]|nr:glycosyltransferase family 9 protein [Planctomycetota bacterium]
MSAIDLNNINRVLVVRLDDIGDMVLTTPFIRELRRNLPNAWITLIVSETVFNMVELCPYVDEILKVNCKARCLTDCVRNFINAIRFRKHFCNSESYDLAIAPRWDVDLHGASILAYSSKATHRIGYSRKVKRSKKFLNWGLDYCFTDLLYDNKLKHEVERNLSIINFLGGEVKTKKLELWLGSEDISFAKQQLSGFRNKFCIGIGIGAGHRRRIWPVTNFIELALKCKDTYGAKFVLVGGPEDEEKGKQFSAQLGEGVIDFTGKTTLRQTVALLKYCDLLVGNDTGSKHIAAAMEVPVVEITPHPFSGDPSRNMSPKRFGAWGVKHIVVQPNKALSPCSETCRAQESHCIRSVKVESVYKAIGKLLSDHEKAIAL